MTMQRKHWSASELADKASEDKGLQTFVAGISPAAEMVKRAPADVALHLSALYNDDQLSDFAIPFSKQKDLTGQYGEKIGANMLPSYIWDYVEAKDPISNETIKYQWYRDKFFLRTTAGVTLAYAKDKIDTVLKEKGKIEGEWKIVHDGREVNLKEVPTSQLEKLQWTYNNRINSGSKVYRQAVGIIRMFQAVEASFGTQEDPDNPGHPCKGPDGKPVWGKVSVQWVYNNPDDTNSGLAIAPIRIVRLNPQNGNETANCADFTVAEFLNLDIEAAIQKGGTYATLVESKRKKGDTTAAGQGETEEAEERKTTLSMQNIDDVLANFILAIDSDDFRKAFVAKLSKAIKNDAEAADTAIYQIGALRKWTNDLWSAAFQTRYDAIVEGIEAKAKAELNAKLALLEAAKNKAAA